MRVLHFTSHQIYWEFVTHSASEAHPEGLSQVGYLLEKDWSPQDFKKTRQFKKNYDHSELESEIYSIWSNILYYYTWAKPSDKFVAISRMAREMQRHLGSKDQYVAGLWKRFLVPELLWEVSLGLGNTQRAIRRAPSCLWAPVDSPLVSAPNSLTILTQASSMSKSSRAILPIAIPSWE
jgi:hypothetical protein